MREWERDLVYYKEPSTGRFLRQGFSSAEPHFVNLQADATRYTTVGVWAMYLREAEEDENGATAHHVPRNAVCLEHVILKPV